VEIYDVSFCGGAGFGASTCPTGDCWIGFSTVVIWGSCYAWFCLICSTLAVGGSALYTPACFSCASGKDAFGSAGLDGCGLLGAGGAGGTALFMSYL